MGNRTDVWTYLLITALSLLVWVWAAGETRDAERFAGIPIEFSAGDSAAWSIETDVASITVVVEGSQWAISRAEEAMRDLVIDLPTDEEQQTLELLPLLRNHPRVRETGISVVSTSPSSASLTVDRIETVPVRVRPALPRIQTVGEVVVEPSQASLSMPARLRRLYPEDAFVEAFLGREELDRLEPGVAHTIQNVTLRLPEQLAQDSRVRIDPPDVTLTFTIRSQIRDLALDSPVRVQLAGPPEDLEYLVAFEPKQLRDVTVSAPFHIIEKIEAGEAVVVAMVHLRSSEKESRIAQKPVTYFMALWEEDGAEVAGRVGDTNAPPLIDITISDRHE